MQRTCVEELLHHDVATPYSNGVSIVMLLLPIIFQHGDVEMQKGTLAATYAQLEQAILCE